MNLASIGHGSSSLVQQNIGRGVTPSVQDCLLCALDSFFLGFADGARYADDLDYAILIDWMWEPRDERQRGPDKAVMVARNAYDSRGCRGGEVFNCGSKVSQVAAQ